MLPMELRPARLGEASTSGAYGAPLCRFAFTTFTIDAPKTKALAGKLKTLGMHDVLILTDRLDDNLFLSARNLPNVMVLEARHADPVSLMRFEKVLVTKAAVKHLEEALA